MTDYKAQYEELQTKMGEMGREVGGYRTFYQDILPLLEKLDKNPELVEAIVQGKIDKSLAQAVFDGRVNITDAAVVSQANQQVRSELGQKVYESMSSEKIQQLIEEKANELRKDFEEKADLRTFEEKTEKFIAETGDFADFAEEIDKWLGEHGEVADVEVAYWAVKGKMSETKAKQAADAANTERNREMVANATGGGITANTVPDGTPLIDKLVSGPANPLF